jgi:hypothetical protein
MTLANTRLYPIWPYISDSEVHLRLHGTLSIAPNFAHTSTRDLLGLGEIMSSGTSKFAAEFARRNGPGNVSQHPASGILLPPPNRALTPESPAHLCSNFQSTPSLTCHQPRHFP